MLRVLLSAPTRLVFGGVLRSSEVFRVVPIAAASAWFVAQPLASSFYRFSGFASLRAHSTVAMPLASAINKSVPKSAAELRVLDVLGVVNFVKNNLKIDSDDYEKLVKQKIDGAALLETSVSELCDRYGLTGGAAHAIMRGIAPAVAEVRAAATKASAITLKVYPPLKEGRRNNHVKMTMTPEDFRIKFVLSSAPLQLVSKDGAVVKDIFTLEEAVEAIREPTVFLRWTRSFGDDVVDLRGFVDNTAKALEQETTRALANDAGLASAYGPLSAVNSAEHFTVSRRGGGKLLQKIEVDGLVVGEHVVLFNSTKHTPSLDDVDDAVADAKKLQGILQLQPETLSTKPALVKVLLNDIAHLPIIPFLCGDNFSAKVEAKCATKGVGIVRPGGDGFVVKAAGRTT